MNAANRRNASPIFHRSVTRSYPVIDRAEGACLYDTSGKQYLDAAGGVFVVNIGHGVADIAAAMAAQAGRVAFAHTAHFSSEPELEFANKLLDLAPDGFNKVWLCTSGSQANETAVKLARSYHLLNGDEGRVQVVSRWNSYHGSSLGALALTGHSRRRQQYAPYLFPSPKIEPPYCYRCALGRSRQQCGLACADELETAIRRIGASNISAFIAEPVSGGPLGALVPPQEYFPRIREICDRHGILMIVDEVITGAGRTGRPLGIDHFGVTPDIITLAKGIGGGYVPVGAVLVHDRVYRAFEEQGVDFRHGETFTGHAVIAAAGSAVLDHIQRDGLIDRTRLTGEVLERELQRLSPHPMVGDIRGLGLLWGIELVADQATKEPFPRSLCVAERVADAAFDAGLLVIPGTGCVDGETGDTISLSPPFVITEDDVRSIVDRLETAIKHVASDVMSG
jgi:adenosylmethionine-8-amino-7-oxononanoate aminotransferase